MIKYILILSILGTFLLANNIQSVDNELIPTITVGDDDDKKYARKRGKQQRGRRRGGSGLR